MPSEGREVRNIGTQRLDCPERGCRWSTTFDPKKAYEREKEKIDAAMHYVDEHGGRIPDGANFGNHQCPECFEILGLNGTASCSECGYIPPEARLVPQDGMSE